MLNERINDELPSAFGERVFVMYENLDFVDKLAKISGVKLHTISAPVDTVDGKTVTVRSLRGSGTITDAESLDNDIVEDVAIKELCEYFTDAGITEAAMYIIQTTPLHGPDKRHVSYRLAVV